MPRVYKTEYMGFPVRASLHTKHRPYKKVQDYLDSLGLSKTIREGVVNPWPAPFPFPGAGENGDLGEASEDFLLKTVSDKPWILNNLFVAAVRGAVVTDLAEYYGKPEETGVDSIYLDCFTFEPLSVVRRVEISGEHSGKYNPDTTRKFIAGQLSDGWGEDLGASVSIHSYELKEDKRDVRHSDIYQLEREVDQRERLLQVANGEPGPLEAVARIYGGLSEEDFVKSDRFLDAMFGLWYDWEEVELEVFF